MALARTEAERHVNCGTRRAYRARARRDKSVLREAHNNKRRISMESLNVPRRRRRFDPKITFSSSLLLAATIAVRTRLAESMIGSYKSAPDRKTQRQRRCTLLRFLTMPTVYQAASKLR